MSSESDKKPIDGAVNDEKKGNEVEEQEIKWDEQYDNPAAEIILVSSGGVQSRRLGIQEEEVSYDVPCGQL